MSGQIPDLRARTPFDGVILSGLDGVAPVKIGSSGKEFPPLSAVFSSNLAYVAMDDASRDTSNVHASAAALHVLRNIHDTKNHHWSGGRFVLRRDKRNLELAEVFIAAITGAFTALVNGSKFPNVRTSLSNKNAVIKAAEDAALARIEVIRARKSEQRAIQKVEEAKRRRDRDDEDFNPGDHGSNRNMDGSNCRDEPAPSDKDADDNDDDANYILLPNPPIQKGNYTFYPPIPERNQTAASIATRLEDAEEAKKKRFTDEELAAQFVYQPADPSVEDKRHPTVIEHEKKTGIKNVVGTGLHGKLTRKDILEAANNLNNFPDDLKPLFMSRDQLIEYEKKEAAQAKAAAKAAKEGAAAAEANQQEKLRIAAQNDSEQENPIQSPLSKASGKPISKVTQLKPPSFDPDRVIASSETPIPAAHITPRKSKDRVVVPDSDSEDTPPPQVDFGIFVDNIKNRRAQREAFGSSVRVTRNGSPIASVPPHEFRIGERKRFISPALPLEDIERKLFGPVVPKTHNKLDARYPLRDEREESVETEELTQRSPAPTSAPRPNVKSNTSSQPSKAAGKMKAQSNSRMGSFGSSVVAPSDRDSYQLALELNMELNSNSNSKKRRREFGVSQSESHNSSQPPPKRGQPSKLHQHANSVRSASPAPSVVPTAASERPMRTKKSMQPRQSLPAQATLKSITSANNLAIARAAKKAKADSKTRVKNEDSSNASTRSSSTTSEAAAKKKLTDEEKVKLPIAVTSEEYDVEAIVGHRVHDNGITYYHVKWVGYPEEDNTWEPANNLCDAHKILNAYRSGLHNYHQVEDVLGHRSGYKYLTDDAGQRKQKYVLEYLVKWKGSAREYNSWEWEETIKGRGGIQPLLYYRIRKRVGFGGNGHWSEAKKVAAIKMLKEAGLQPEAGGRISAADFAETIKDEDDGRDELALSARAESVYESAREDYGMNQTI